MDRELLSLDIGLRELPGDVAATVTSLWRLAWNCDREAPLDGTDWRRAACTAAASLCGDAYPAPTDWQRALLDLQAELAASRAGTERERATQEFYERLNYAIRRQDDQEEKTMATTAKNPAKTRAKRPPRKQIVEAWLDRTIASNGEGPIPMLQWRCPKCRTEHDYEKTKTCGCGFSRPLCTQMKRIDEQSTERPKVHSNHSWVCPDCGHPANHISRKICERCNWDGSEIFAEMYTEGLRRFGNLPESQTEAAAKEAAVDVETGVRDVPLELVDENPINTRRNFGELQELAASLQQHGQLQECLGRARGDRVELIAGGRRYRATKMAGLPTLRVRIIDVDDLTALDLMGKENEDREQWDAISKAAWYQAELDARGMSHRDLAKHLQVSPADIANHVRLLKLPAAWQDKVISGEITPTMARSIAKWHDREAILKAMASTLKRRRNLTAEQFDRELDNAVRSRTRPVERGEHFSFQHGKKYEYGYVRIGKKPLEANAEALDIVEIDRAWGRGKDRRCFNLDLWWQLQQEGQAAYEKRSARAGKGKASSNGRSETAADQKRKREQQALQERVWKYKVRWLQAQAIERLEEQTDPAHRLRLILALAATGESTFGQAVVDAMRECGVRCSEVAWDVDVYGSLAEALSDVEGQTIEFELTFLRRILGADPFDYRQSLKAHQVPAIAADLGVDLATWQCDREFLELFLKDQLAALVKEWKLKAPGIAGNAALGRAWPEKRKDLIDAILAALEAQPRNPPRNPPKILLKAKG